MHSLLVWKHNMDIMLTLLTICRVCLPRLIDYFWAGITLMRYLYFFLYLLILIGLVTITALEQ